MKQNNKDLGHESRIAVVETTFSEIQHAQACARLLVEEMKCSGCCHIFPHVSSIYVWNGEIHNSTEVVMRIKTDIEKVYSVIEVLKAHHQYKNPEIFVLRGWIQGSQQYEEWLYNACLEKNK